MNWVKNLKISQKVLSFVIISALFTAIAGYTGYHYNNQTAQSSSVLYNDNLLPIKWMNENRSQFRANEANLLWIILTNNKQEQQKHLDDLKRRAELFNANMANYEKKQLSDEEKEIITSLKESLKEYRNLRVKILEMIESGLNAEAYSYFVSNNKCFSDTGKYLRELTEYNAKSADSISKENTSNALLAKNIIISIVTTALLLLILVGLFLASLISKPVVEMTGNIDKLSREQTEFDVNGKERKDEIGTMARAMEIARQNIIKKLDLEAKEREEVARRQARANKMEELTNHFDIRVSEMIEIVASATTEMRTTAENMSGNAEQTNMQASNVAAAAEQATTNVGTVASAAEELSASIQEISRNVTLATDVANKASEEADRASVIFERLNNSSKKIGEVIGMINDIADQTNLLALNATIEAARAGEAGKGFAVVANEVKNLANQTAKATEEISEQISTSQSDTNDAVDAIKNITNIINRIAEVISAVMSAVEEQDAATQEIAGNVVQASTGTKAVSENITIVSRAATETGVAAEQVLQASDSLAKNMEDLKFEVTSFLENIKKI